jgi:uncharacterized membrane protein YkvI
MAPTFFQRFLLPGFAFKAVIIGGGYATGRELVEFFFPSGPIGGLMGLTLTGIIWSAVATLTFLYARATQSYDYKTFFRHLLGPLWPSFEIVYLLLILLILSVFGAAAGEIFALAFGLPPIVGTLALMAAIMVVAMAGNRAVEALFKYVSFFLYGVYALVIVLTLTRVGDRIGATLKLDVPTDGWVTGGITYAGYNLLGAVVILPMIRHLTSSRDAVVAGLLCGPLAALPAFLFYLCTMAYYPEIGSAVIPSDMLLAQLGTPWLHLIFQLMILAALLEGGVGLIHAINQRIAGVYEHRGRIMSARTRLAAAAIILVGAIFVASRFGLIELVAKGYTAFAYLIMAVYVIPLLTFGAWQLHTSRRARSA